MSAEHSPADPELITAETTRDRRPERGFWAGCSSLIMAVLVLAMSVYLSIGIVRMDVPDGVDAPGPRFFPLILMICGYVLSALLAIQSLRSPESAEPGRQRSAGGGAGRRSDWRTLGIVLAAFLAFSLLLNPLGWILSAALMFWLISFALGSGRPLFDIALAAVFSSAVQVAFSAGLGLNLPGGIIEGVL